MSDGAHMGIGAERALKTILGGEPQPTTEERQSRQETLERLAKAPKPDGEQPESYGAAADAIASAFLVVLQEHPDTPLETDTLWAAVKHKWPSFDDWVRGATGFQVGWATNVVRWLRDAPPVSNPAIVSIGVSETQK